MDKRFTQAEKMKSPDKSRLSLCNVPRKEFYETEQTVKKGLKVLREMTGIPTFKHFYDFCSGHTFNAHYVLSRHYAKYADVYDIKFPKSSKKLETYYPTLMARIQHHEENIFTTQYDNLDSNSVVFSVHPCKDLSYRVSEIAIQNQLPLVVVPCCIAKNHRVSWVDSFPNINPSEKHVMKLVEYITSYGYKVQIRAIDRKYTPRNKIIIGVPK
jgi:hypothetical protein